MRHALNIKFHAFEDRLTVRQQIGIATAALCVVMAIALAIAAALVARQQTSNLIRSQMTVLASTTAGTLDRIMLTRFHEIRTLAQLEPLRVVWGGDPAKARNVLEKLQADFPEFAWIGFAGVDGVVRTATRKMLEGASVSARPWFIHGLEGPTVEDVHEAALLSELLGTQPSGEPFRFVDVAFPVRDNQNHVIGVIGAHLSWAWIHNLRQRILDAAGVDDIQLSLISADGQVLLAGGGDQNAYGAERMAAMKADKRGIFAETVNGSSLLAAYAFTTGYKDYKGFGWIVIARRPTAAAFAAAEQIGWVILALGAVAAAFGVAFAIFIAGRIARPIHALALDADRIGRDPAATMLPRQRGSLDVIHLTMSLRSLLRRVGLAEQKSHESEFRAAENARQFAEDISQLRKLADTDPLTGLLNRRAFHAFTHDAMSYFQRYGRAVAILVVDIDHFKLVNDHHGHAAGDAAIKRISELIGDTIRATDKAARFGGEEFVVLLREVNEETARSLAERLRERIAQTPIGYGQQTMTITVSVGVAMVSGKDRDIDDVIERADQALYMAKNTGRNRVFLMRALDEQPEPRAA